MVHSFNACVSLLCIFCLVVFKSCQDLPEASQTGAGTFGMKINGESWRGDGTITFGPASTAYYRSSDKGVQIQSIVTRQNGSQEKFNMVVTNTNTIGKYVMGNFPSLKSIDSTRFWYNDNEEFAYKLRQGVQNSVEITRLDTLREIVSGKFSVSLVNRNNDTLKLTEGRFDLRLNIIK